MLHLRADENICFESDHADDNVMKLNYIACAYQGCLFRILFPLLSSLAIRLCISFSTKEQLEFGWSDEYAAPLR
jgi:hypothetical protein